MINQRPVRLFAAVLSAGAMLFGVLAFAQDHVEDPSATAARAELERARKASHKELPREWVWHRKPVNLNGIYDR